MTVSSLRQSLNEALTPSVWLANHGVELTAYQIEIVDSLKNTHVVAGRQSGKSFSAACLAVWYAIHHPRSTTILASYNQRQADELGGKVKEINELCGISVPNDAITYSKYDNKARVMSIAGLDTSARSYTAGLIIIDEAAKCSYDLLNALKPTQVTIRGSRMVMISSAFEKKGFFYETDMMQDTDHWKYIKVMATDVPRITPEKLEAEKRSMPEAIFLREYFCTYMNILESSLFTEAEINDCFVDTVQECDLT